MPKCKLNGIEVEHCICQELDQGTSEFHCNLCLKSQLVAQLSQLTAVLDKRSN